MRCREGERVEVCARCGGNGVRPATRPEQLGRRIASRSSAAGAWSCRDCGTSWSGGSRSSALSGASGSAWRARTWLPRALLRRLAPERAQRLELGEELAEVRIQIGGFPLLSPAGWAGVVSLDGVSWSLPSRGTRVLQEVTVIAGRGDRLLGRDHHVPGSRAPGSRIEIRFSRAGRYAPEGEALRAFVERAVHPDDEEVRRRWEARLPDRWRDGTVLVDGLAIPARLLAHDDTDVRVGTFSFYGHRVLIISEGIDVDSRTFVRLTDPTPLVDGYEFRRHREGSVTPPA